MASARLCVPGGTCSHSSGGDSFCVSAYREGMVPPCLISGDNSMKPDWFMTSLRGRLGRTRTDLAAGLSPFLAGRQSSILLTLFS